MSTRSTISIKNEDGTYDSVYCHWDGYIEHNGAILSKHYNDEESIRDLISHGEMSSLAENLENSVFYHRDKGEQLRVVRGTDDLYTWSQDYNYVFKEGKWYYFKWGAYKMKKLRIPKKVLV